MEIEPINKKMVGLTEDGELDVIETEEVEEGMFKINNGKKQNLNFFDELREIIKLHKDGSEESLDGDEVDKLVKHLKNQINLIEGNITEEEYDKKEF